MARASKYFSFQVDSRGEKADAYVLNLKLFQEQKLLLETKAKLSKASPLVIRGPQVGDGQLGHRAGRAISSTGILPVALRVFQNSARW